MTYSVLQEKLLLWEKSMLFEFVKFLTRGKELFHMHCRPALAFNCQLCNVVHLVFHGLNNLILLSVTFAVIRGLFYCHYLLYLDKFKQMEFYMEINMQMIEPKISNILHHVLIVTSIDFSGVFMHIGQIK